jgi:hypothetical protein
VRAAKSELQRLKPILDRSTDVVAKATTRKDFPKTSAFEFVLLFFLFALSGCEAIDYGAIFQGGGVAGDAAFVG